MAKKLKHSGLNLQQQVLVDTYKSLKDIVTGVAEELLASYRGIPESDREFLLKLFKAKVENNAKLLKLVDKQLTTVRRIVDKESRQRLRKDHLGRFLIFPLENRLSDKMERNWVYRPLIKDYIIILKSILGIEFVTDIQPRIDRIVSFYCKNDNVDWDEVFEDRDSKDILCSIVATLRERFSTPHAMPFFIKRMNQSKIYKNSEMRYTEEDFSVYLKLLFRSEEELS